MPASLQVGARETAARPRVCRAATAIGSSPRIGGSAVERQPADDREASVFAVGQHAGGREDAERDRQIERRADLAHVGRREAHGDPLGRKRKPGVANRRPHAVAALAHRRIRQADHRHARQPGATSTSTETGIASMPTTAAADRRASMDPGEQAEGQRGSGAIAWAHQHVVNTHLPALGNARCLSSDRVAPRNEAGRLDDLQIARRRARRPDGMGRPRLPTSRGGRCRLGRGRTTPASARTPIVLDPTPARPGVRLGHP